MTVIDSPGELAIRVRAIEVLLYVILLSCENSSLVDFESTKIDITVKPVLSSLRLKIVFKPDYGLMQVKSLAECSKRAFCDTLDLH